MNRGNALFDEALEGLQVGVDVGEDEQFHAQLYYGGMINWLVIGIGDITTKRVIPAIQAEPRSQLYGIVTRDPAKAAPYSVKVWTSLEDALSDAAIDAIYVASPVAMHAPQTLAALRAGRHVLCEKPVASNYPEARTMVDAAAECGRRLGIAYYRRMYPKIQRAKALLEQGAVGRPVMAWLANHYWYDESGYGTWRLDPKMAGGVRCTTPRRTASMC